MTDTDTARRSSLIGPLPEMPQAPTPWQVNPDEPQEVLDAVGRPVLDMNNVTIAALIVELVNAAAAGQAETVAESREVDHYVDSSGDPWRSTGEGVFTQASTPEAAMRYASMAAPYANWTLEKIRNRFGPLTPVYVEP